MKLNHTDEINYNKSCIHLLIMTWVCVAVVLFADTLTIFIDSQYLGESIFLSGIKNYVVLPGALNVVAMLIVHTLSIFFLKRKMFIAQAFLYIVGVTFICFVLARFNQYIGTNLIFFIVPVILSIFYLDRKVLIFSFVLSMITFAIHVLIIVNSRDGGGNQNILTVNAEVSIVIMLIIFIAGMIIINRLESIHKAVQEAEVRNNEDILTGYLNHSGFYDDLDETFKNANREKGDFSLAIIDIDNFTLINEEYGHGFGDEVIEVIVSSINKSLVNTAKAYRYGGEEFVIICKGEQAIIVNMIGTILEEFRNKTELKLGVRVTASAGICEYDPAQFSGKRDIFAAVDEALYVAKRLGKNQYVIWNDAIVRDSFIHTGKIDEEEEIIESDI